MEWRWRTTAPHLTTQVGRPYPHNCLGSDRLCCSGQELDTHWSDSSSIPDLRLAMVQPDLCVGENLSLKDAVDLQHLSRAQMT